MTTGVDGKVELGLELDRLGQVSRLAAAAPRGTGLAGFLAAGIDTETEAGDFEGEYWRLTVSLIQALSIWWPTAGYTAMPVMTPWCIRDRSARYDQGPEMWGAPRADGYLRDDNSIIKKLPLPLLITAPSGHPYSGRKPLRGFTACHIWRDLEDGGVGGVDQWIYSNMANLVWLPSPIMSLTDHHPRVQALLRRTRQALVRNVRSSAAVAYSEYAWRRLTPLGTPMAVGQTLNIESLARFEVTDAFIRRRLATIDLVTGAVDKVLAGQALPRRVVCSRYASGLPLLEHGALQNFRTELSDYASVVRSGLQLI